MNVAPAIFNMQFLKCCNRVNTQLFQLFVTTGDINLLDSVTVSARQPFIKFAIPHTAWTGAIIKYPKPIF